MGELLSCIRSVTALKISIEDFGKSRHTASSEPFFYDQSYAMVRHTSPIAVDSHGRCVIAEEEGKRNEKVTDLNVGNVLLSVNFQLHKKCSQS